MFEDHRVLTANRNTEMFTSESVGDQSVDGGFGRSAIGEDRNDDRTRRMPAVRGHGGNLTIIAEQPPGIRPPSQPLIGAPNSSASREPITNRRHPGALVSADSAGDPR